MRFAWGPPPSDPEFEPEREGWIPLRLSPGKVVGSGSLIGIALVFVMGYAWSLTDAPAIEIHFRFSGTRLEVLSQMTRFLAEFLLFFGATFLLHEFSHAAGYPRMGCSRDTIIGIWISRGLCYAAYRGSLSRNRFILSAALPLVLLSVLPLAFGMITRFFPTVLVLLSMVNAFGSGGDTLIILTLLVKVPRRAILRDQGWNSWWKATSST